jgi:uncharacterized protein YndB with AHSA1/START domain
MPTNKDFKRLVRQRMQKTGESYTAARAHLISRRPSRAAAPTAAPHVAKPPAAVAYAELARLSDAAVKKATGCTWERWVKTLDHHQAFRWPHRHIARFVRETYKTPPWWTQMVVVGYERIKGLRAVGQARGGGYRVSKRRVFAVPVGRLYRAFSSAAVRRRWLPGLDLRVRSARQDRSLRITWSDGTSVEVLFTEKGVLKSQVALEHGRLADQSVAARTRSFWTERLDALARMLQPAAQRAR